MSFDYRNNVIVTLNAAIAAGVTSISVTPAQQALLPSGLQNTIATLEEVDANGVITKREGILITNRAANILTATRAYQAMPDSDSATTHTQVSFPFDPVNGARLGLYWTRTHAEAISSIETDYLKKSDYVATAFLGGTSAVGTDSYQISSTEVSAYVNNQRFFVTFDVANSGSATFEVNGIGAKPLTKFDGDTLATGDITANFQTIVMYNAIDDAFRMVSIADYSGSLSVDSLRKDYELGQDMTAGDNLGASFIGRELTAYQNAGAATILLGNIAGKENAYLHVANEDSINLKEYTLRLRKVGAPVDNVTVTYRDTYGVIVDEVIPAAGIGAAYSTFTFTKYNEVKFKRKNTDNSPESTKILQIGRDGGLDAVNYYEIEGVTGGAVIANTYQALGLVSTSSSGGGIVQDGPWREVGRLTVADTGLFDIAFQIRNSGTVVLRNPQLQVWIGADTTSGYLVFDQTWVGSNYGGGVGLFQNFSFLGQFVANQDVFVRTRNTNSAQTLAIEFQNYIINNGLTEDKPNTDAIIGFDPDMMFLSDYRDIETNIAHGVLVSSGLRTEDKQFVIDGLINNSANTPHDDLVLNGGSGEYGPISTGTAGLFQIAKQMESTTVYVSGSEQLSANVKKQPTVMVFSSNDRNYYRANNATYEVAGYFRFPGSDIIGVPTSMQLVCVMNAPGEEGQIKVVDDSTNDIIAEAFTGDIGTGGVFTIDLGFIREEFVSKTPITWTIQGREVTGSDFDMHSLIINY